MLGGVPQNVIKKKGGGRTWFTERTMSGGWASAGEVCLVLRRHQKAPGKGGHHLRLFDPITHRRSTPEDRKRDPPHTNTGPAGYGDCYAFEGSSKVEVILTTRDRKEITSPEEFKSTQFWIFR